MKVGIMQPYFLPYIGYFQLISSVDIFVVYDNIKYTKKGWINRNRYQLNDKEAIFTIPLKNDSDYLDVAERRISSDFDRLKLVNRLKGAYARAPHYAPTISLVEQILNCTDDNLFKYIHNSIAEICRYLNIDTRIAVSSTASIDHNLQGSEKVIALCKHFGATTYINPIGGIDLYSRQDFATHGIKLNFIKPSYFNYHQFGNDFVPWLSIIDVLMFNPVNNVRTHIHSKYDLL